MLRPVLTNAVRPLQQQNTNPASAMPDHPAHPANQANDHAGQAVMLHNHFQQAFMGHPPTHSIIDLRQNVNS